MVDTGYFYVMRNADIAANLPAETQLQMPDSDRYEAIPFLQIILHGSVEYAGAAVNLAEDPTQAFLRAVSYGAAPAFTWSCQESENGKLYFEDTLSLALDFYTRANTVLADLRDVRILRHTNNYLGKKGITRTAYANDAVIYVNFNKTAAQEIDGLTIEPLDFVRIG
jgi:hypothetical protein